MPNLVRTWAPRGQTPRLRCAGHWTKVSAISAVTVSPQHRRVALYARFHPDQNIRSPEVVAFLRALLRHLRGPVVLLWDRGQPHRGALVTRFLERHPRLHTFWFPGYAPELNPDEFVWTHFKRATANSAPHDNRELLALLRRPYRRLRRSQQLLWSCIHASDLPWT